MGCSCKGNQNNQTTQQTAQQTTQTDQQTTVVKETLANKIKKTVEKYYNKNS